MVALTKVQCSNIVNWVVTDNIMLNLNTQNTKPGTLYIIIFKRTVSVSGAFSKTIKAQYVFTAINILFTKAILYYQHLLTAFNF